MNLLAVDDGIWSGNLDAADVLFLIAAIVFAVAAIVPWTRSPRGDFSISLVPAGLCLVALAWLVL